MNGLSGPLVKMERKKLFYMIDKKGGAAIGKFFLVRQYGVTNSILLGGEI